MWNQDLRSLSNMESLSEFQREILTRVTIQRGFMTQNHIPTWNYDPGSQFNVKLWPQVKIQRWIMTPGYNSTLNCDPKPGSQFNVESWLGVKIQHGINTLGNQVWNQDLVVTIQRGPHFIRRRGRNTMTSRLGGRNSTWKIRWILSTARWIKTPRVEIQLGENSILHRCLWHSLQYVL